MPGQARARGLLLMLHGKNQRPRVACPDDVSAKAEKEPKLVMGDPGPVAGAGGTVRSVGSAWRQRGFTRLPVQDLFVLCHVINVQ